MAFPLGMLSLVMSCLSAGSVIHVDDSATGAGTGVSWTHAYVHLQDALSAAVAGDQVWVATGTYRPDLGALQVALDPFATFAIKSGVAVYGGFSGVEVALEQRAGLFDQTVLTGDLLGNDQAGFVGYDENSGHVVSLIGAGPGTRFDGFTVRGGFARPASYALGGGVRVSGGGPTIAHCTLRDNQVVVPGKSGDARGGGLYADSTNLELADCTFKDNRAVVLFGDFATAAGGGAAVAGGSLHVLRTVFGNNKVSGGFTSNGFGAGLATQSTKVVVEDSAIVGNQASGGMLADGIGQCRGGGLYVDDGSLVVTRTAFTSNRTECHADTASGGGLDARSADPVIRECRFEGNVSRAGGDAVDAVGGALCSMFQTLHLESCSFLGNQAVSFNYDSWGWGGAIYHNFGNAKIVSSVFSGNRAYCESGSGFALGGAILGYDVAGSGNELAVINSTLHANFAEPTVGLGGAFNVSNLPLRLVNCILWNNSAAGSGEAGQIWSNPPPALDHCCMMGWSGALGGAGNFGSDPLFASAAGADGTPGTADDDLRLRSGSPCIDAGDNGALPADAFDADGDGNLSEPTPFDAASRPRRVDDMTAIDGGAGLAPLVDIGAHESPGFHDANVNLVQDDLEHCELDLHYRGPGSTTLSVCGDALTTAGSAATLLVTGAPPRSRLFIVLGTTVAPTPFQSGILVPFPPAWTITLLTTDATGQASAAVRGGGGPQFTIAAQVLVPSSVPLEFSNAVLGISG